MPFRGGIDDSKDLSVFEQGMVVGARHTGLIVSRTAMLLDRLGRYTVYRGIWERTRDGFQYLQKKIEFEVFQYILN